MGTTLSASTPPLPSIEVSQPRYFAGIDIGGTEAKAVVVEVRNSDDPQIVRGSDYGTPSEVAQGPMHVTGRVIPEALRRSLSQAGINAKLIEGVGADFPAPVNAKAGIVLDLANLKHPDWRGARVRDGLMLGLSSVDDLKQKVVAVDNDAAAAMYGLVHELAPTERRKVILGFFIGTGLGGAKLVNSKNYFNNEGGGTEPGATVVCFDEDPFLLGRPGSASERRLEEFVSLTAIERQLPILNGAGLIPEAHPILKLQAKEGKTEWRVRAEKVISFADKALESGDMQDFSLRLFKVQQEALGRYLAILIQSDRPAHIFIGGGVVDPRRASEHFRDWYVEGIKAAAKEKIVQPMRQEKGFPEFHIPKDGDFAAPKGAALMAARVIGAIGKKK